MCIDDMGHWRSVATQAEGDLEQVLVAIEVEMQAGPVATQANAVAHTNTLES